MRKILAITMILSLWAGAAWAAKTVENAAKSSTAQTAQAASAASRAEQNLDAMKPGLAYNFSMDFKIFDITNPNFANSNGPSSWYFYPTYRAALSNVFENGIGLMVDAEKPGYASVNYPTLKINELYAKIQQGNLYVKVGRQVFGDTSDLLLGFQNDAIAAGYDLGTIDLQGFFAKTDLLMPWGGNMGGMFGFVPDFQFTRDMGLKGYLLVGTESITVTSGTPPTTSDKVNALVTLGGKYYLALPMSETAKLDLAGQLGLQFAMAQTSAGQSIDATNVGMKVDGGFSNLPPKGLGFKANVHMVFTGGVDTTATSPKAPFCSTNALVGSGPGLFNKIQDGAGAYTYLDTLNGSARFQQYAGVFAAGFDGALAVAGFEGGAGFMAYVDTFRYDPAPSTAMIGAEIDEFASFRVMPGLTLYQQFAVFLPTNRSTVPNTPAPGAALKFLLGSSLTF